jgi:hypothetical protein
MFFARGGITDVYMPFSADYKCSAFQGTKYAVCAAVHNDFS